MYREWGSGVSIRESAPTPSASRTWTTHSACISYRRRLNGQWGIVDVADCVNAAKHLVTKGRVDARRLVIRGRSAGGYITLAALTFYPGVFTAGASYYGIGDIEAMARHTHKFESRYFDSLIGPYVANPEVYRARSPIHFVDQLSCPLIIPISRRWWSGVRATSVWSGSPGKRRRRSCGRSRDASSDSPRG